MIRKNKATDSRPRKNETGLAPAWRSPYDRFEEMDRWFEDLRQSLWSWGPTAIDPTKEDRLRVRQPLVDLADNGEDFLVRAELPGVAKEDVDLSVTPEGLDIRAESKGERQQDEKGYSYRERTYSALRRTISFPAEVLPDRAQASLKDGPLQVRVPKREPTPEREPVKVRVE